MNPFQVLFAFCDLAVFYTIEIIKSNWKVAKDVVTAKHYMKPAIIAHPLTLEREWEVYVFASLVTMTPGTIALDLSDDLKTLYLHVMYVEEIAKVEQEIKKLEDKIGALTP
ncbi:Na+/H+ antiporter subunit E [Acanthopleuribacter pedis]|uniref:Na+/H+ antiporter subunit E n=1 Tax=Acanthopleuribacter pedis TaxID=442870 RepID=A0A8J7QKL3_9BACT|nr:Na+/H+ antiporter subunit E [Acanthopleuribacter pedis]MBO1322751.1 Na+/H+ antiporter subunit E [Acanthopleuribacter pedis]